MDQSQTEFLKVLSDYQGIIHKVNLIYFRSEMDRQDNFQEVVYQLWRAFPFLREKEKIASWIYAVAINTSISKLRKDSKLTFCESVSDLNISDGGEETNCDVDYHRLINALYQLNQIDKSIMLLYMEGYSYEEISAIIGISASNVGVKIHRLKQQLQKQLKDKESGL